jgi:hypothetical protein
MFTQIRNHRLLNKLTCLTILKDYVFIPEDPAKVDWKDQLCKKLLQVQFERTLTKQIIGEFLSIQYWLFLMDTFLCASKVLRLYSRPENYICIILLKFQSYMRYIQVLHNLLINWWRQAIVWLKVPCPSLTIIL